VSLFKDAFSDWLTRECLFSCKKGKAIRKYRFLRGDFVLKVFEIKMPISSAYKQTEEVANQPWNTTKSRRLSSTLPLSLNSNKNDDSRSKRPHSATTSRSNYDNSTKQFISKPVWPTGSFEEPLSEEQNLTETNTKTMKRKTLKRRETLPEFGENAFTPVPKFKRSNSDSLLEPRESGSKRKIRRTTVAERIRKYRKRYGVKSSSSGTRSKKVTHKMREKDAAFCIR